MQCKGIPQKKCKKYLSKEVCKNEKRYCLKNEQVCTNEVNICVAQEKICVQKTLKDGFLLFYLKKNKINLL